MLNDTQKNFESVLSAKRTEEKENSSYLFTSESVTEGHPDKVCDQISDAILDTYLNGDPFSRCAVECMVTENNLIIAGEVSSKAEVNHEQIAREVIVDIGYTDPALGFDNHCHIVDLIHNQAPELNRNEGAGDQGIMFGYACDQTPELMPMPIVLAHKLTRRLSEVRKKNIIEGLHPDGKSQVTVKFENSKPVSVDTIIISAHHDQMYSGIRFKRLQTLIEDYVIRYIISPELLTNDTKIHVNPSGPWYESGGPKADTGLTGRKIIADTYGGWARHGGGTFSGKDATKVDRSAAYMARYIAKYIVRNKLAKECEIQLGYEIGSKNPVSINVNSYGTAKKNDKRLLEIISDKFDLSVNNIIDYLDLRKPIYQKTSNYGHFGDNSFMWEERAIQSDFDNPNYLPYIRGCFRESIKAHLKIIENIKDGS
ncbi:MAG: methionine adenosyltransferase [Candidatus Cloacimonetes bacterium]|nr:methionine adenosyltransferase [Candidatus Cloacimonadota bacterium]